MTSSYSKVAATRARLIRLVEQLDAGTALPPERELAARWRIARMTVRRATDDLVLAGLVVREQGRGTFVVHPKVSQHMAMTSFTDAMHERGMVPGSRLLNFRTLRTDGCHSRPLRIPADDPVVRFTRVRLANDEPIGLETTWVAARQVPGLTAEDLTGSWYELLARQYGVHIMTGSSVIDIAYASERDASLLNCPPGAALFRIQTTSYGPTGHVVDFGVDLFCGDRYTLMTERMPGTAIRANPRRTRNLELSYE